MKKIFLVGLILMVGSCASIPPESIDLMDIIISKNKKSYELNISLVNKLFAEKREDIDEFIDSDYTERYWENFKKSIPKGVDIEKEMGNIIPAVSSSINEQRNDLQRILEESRLEIINAINEDYKILDLSSTQLKELLESASKVNTKRSEILQKFSDQFKLGIDIDGLEDSIDGFIVQAGKAGADIDKLGKDFLKQIDKLTKTKNDGKD